MVIDTRPADAFMKGHIQGARNVPAGGIANAGIPIGTHIVVYCSDEECGLSNAAAKRLEDAGYKNVDVLEGGFGAWLKAGYPATSGPAIAHAEARSAMRPSEFKKGMEAGTAFTVDVRTAAEYKAGHVGGAYSAPLEELAGHYIDLPKGKKIVVYDKTPKRAKDAVDRLRKDGFDAAELAGGLAGWVKRGNKLVTR